MTGPIMQRIRQMLVMQGDEIVNLRRNLWPDERISYHSAIYKRATLVAMIREHNTGVCEQGSRQLDYLMDGICAETQTARSILYNARARALGYSN